MATCMRHLGFQFEMTDYAQVAVPSIPDSVDSARTSGYHLPAGSDNMIITDNDRSAQSNPAYRMALLGRDDLLDDGCRGTTYNDVFDEKSDFYKLDEQLGYAQVEISIRLDTDKRVFALNKEWAACMAAAGFNYQAPDEPRNVYVGAEEEISTIEISTRLADLSCRQSINYDSSFYSWRSDEVRHWIAEHAGLVASYATLKTQYLEKVKNYRESIPSS